MSYQLTLSLHIIGFVAWFAGLFYLVRLLIYHLETIEQDKEEKGVLIRQFCIMESRLHNYITLPAAIFTIAMGWHLALIINAISQTWFHVKLTLAFSLIVYHGYAYYVMVKINHAYHTDRLQITSKFLRFYNELATVLLAALVFTAVVKDMGKVVDYFLGFLAVLILLMVIFILNRKFRKKK